jgi:hypothetical protein
MKARASLMETLAWTASGLLLLVMFWRIALSVCAQDPVRAREALAATGAQAPAGRMLVIMDASDTLGVRDAAAAEHQGRPGLSLEVHTVDATTRRGAGLRALLASYGYAELPVVLTIDRDGHVLRVMPFASHR